MAVRRALCPAAAAVLPRTIGLGAAGADDRQRYQENEQFVFGRQRP